MATKQKPPSLQQFDGLLRTGELAVRLNVHPRTVRRWVEAGRLRAIKLPGGQFRFDPADVRTALARGGTIYDHHATEAAIPAATA